jgi:hypothetical protein
MSGKRFPLEEPLTWAFYGPKDDLEKPWVSIKKKLSAKSSKK